MKGLTSTLVLIFLAAALVACGSTNSTDTAAEEARAAKLEELRLKKETAEQEAEQAKAEAEKEVRAAKRAAKKKAGSESAPEPEPEPVPEEVPNVVGMRLPEAESTLSAAGYTTEPENTDTAFGIVVPSHFTVCEQSEPHGDVVNVLAQKYGC